MSKVLDEIWTDDLLKRRADGQAIYNYLLNRVEALRRAGRGTGFTIAIDGQYGSGKSYLLQRLYQQVCLGHPAAFIDAWTDDTMDAPWAALLVAIDEALQPYSSKIDDETKTKLKSKGLKLVTALAKGAAKKGASYVIGDEGWDEVVDAVFEKEAESKIAAYKERKKSVKDLQELLQKVLEGLAEDPADCNPPLFIFIDELDRCRPTYAIQFLEEIKNIFDVPNVVFVMAIHVSQLGKSVRSLYGNEFDGEEYLRRFIDKRYELLDPRIERLVEYHIRNLGIDLARFAAPAGTEESTQIAFISGSCEFWGVRPRDIIRVLDNLGATASMWPYKVPLQLELLLPLVIASVFGIDRATLLTSVNPRRVPTWDYPGKGGVSKKNPKEIFEFFWTKRKSNFHVLQDEWSSLGLDGAILRVLHQEHSLRAPLNLGEKTLMAKYSELVRALAHFTDGDAEAEA